jgi:hypothetical protein
VEEIGDGLPQAGGLAVVPWCVCVVGVVGVVVVGGGGGDGGGC